MAKAKKTKPREHVIRWRASLIKGTPAKFIDFAYAPDAKTAEKQVAEEHKISETYGIGWWPSGRTIDLLARAICLLGDDEGSPRASAQKQQETTGPRARRRPAR